MRHNGTRSRDNEPLYAFIDRFGDSGKFKGGYPASSIFDLG